MAIVAEHGLRVDQSAMPSAQDLPGAEMALSYNSNVYAPRSRNLVDGLQKDANLARLNCLGRVGNLGRSATFLKYYRSYHSLRSKHEILPCTVVTSIRLAPSSQVTIRAEEG